jgi:hypothetical protein
MAFLAGAFLYQVAVVDIGGLLAAVAIPKSYFNWFRPENAPLALALLQFATFGLPIAILVAGGTLAIVRILSSPMKSVLWSVFFGLVACFGFWLVHGAFTVQLPPESRVEAFPPSVLLRQALLPPWWGLPAALGPWVGFAFAVWAAARANRT